MKILINVNLTKEVGQSFPSAARNQTQFNKSLSYTKIKHKKSNQAKNIDMSKFKTLTSGEGDQCLTKSSHHYNFHKHQKTSYIEY